MAPVAHELSSICGVLEPLQTRDTIAGQLAELETTLLEKGTPPMVLVGFSWGAWLGYMLAARYPHLVKKLVLVSSGSFDEKY
ncbi:MAG: alpha/beta hydrolase, partial [bacterium]|nr:alpha/beta hydrolase [bacterium]